MPFKPAHNRGGKARVLTALEADDGILRTFGPVANEPKIAPMQRGREGEREGRREGRREGGRERERGREARIQDRSHLV